MYTSESQAKIEASFKVKTQAKICVLNYHDQSFPRNAAAMKRSRRKRHHHHSRALADTKNPKFFIGDGSTDAIVDSLVTDENSFDFSTNSSSFVNVHVDMANSSVAPLPGSRRSLQVVWINPFYPDEEFEGSKVGI